MKTFKLTILALFLFSSVFSQKYTSQTFNTALGDMKANIGTNGVQVSVNGLLTVGDDNPGFYRWDAASTVVDDGFKVISVSGVSIGRWTRVGNSNTIKLSGTLSGTALQTAYVVTYGTTLPFTPITVIPIPRSAAAAQPSWITNITTTGFTINFSTVPIIGTLNLVLDYVVVKQ